MTSRLMCLFSRVLQISGSGCLVLPASLLLASPAGAATITISTATTTAVKTSTIDGGAAGDITLSNAGSIALTSAAEPAVTIDSNNKVENNGAIRISDVDNSIGYLLLPGASRSLTHNGTLELGPANTSATPVHKNYANNKRGILVQSGGTFTGNILIKTNNFVVRGDSSVGVDLQGVLAGNLDLTGGGIGIQGDNSYGIRVANNLNGELITNSLTVAGINSSAVLVLAPISGKLTHLGAIVVTGYDDLSPDAADDPDNDNATQIAQQSGPAVAIGANVGGGILFEGPSAEDLAAVAAGTKEESELKARSSITSQSSSNAVLISPSVSNGVNGDLTIPVIDASTLPYGVVNRGSITAATIYPGLVAETFRIAGATISSTDYHVLIAGGFRNDGTITSGASKNNATALVIGNLATVPIIVNNGTIGASSNDTGNFSATALLLETGATVPALTNEGTIAATYIGPTGGAYAIRDLSGSLTTIVNRGTINASVTPLDDGDDSNGAETATGAAIAADFSATSNPITFTNELPSGSTSTTLAQIAGDLLFGTGADTFNMKAGALAGDVFFGAGADVLDFSGGQIAGDLDFGAGADIFSITGGAKYAGRIADSDGLLSLQVTNGTLQIDSTDPVAVTGATFGANGVYGVSVDTTADAMTRLDATGTVSFASGAQIAPVISGVLVSSISKVIVSTPDLQIVGALDALVPSANLPFLYKSNLSTSNSAGTDFLTLTLTRKTASELGIPEKLGVVLDPLLRILPTDSDLRFQFLAQSTQAGFDSAFIQFLPSYSDAGIAMAKQSAQSSSRQIRQRLESVLISGGGGGAWGSEAVYSLDRSADGTDRGYDAQGAVLNVGLDDHLTRNVLLGINFGVDHGSYNENGDRDDPVSLRRWTGGLYGGIRAGDFLFSGSALGALSTDSVTRHVVIGNEGRVIDGEWNGWRYSADVSASYFGTAGRWYVLPTVGVNYLHMSDEGYIESGGTDPSSTATTPGNSVALQVDARDGSALTSYAELVVGYNLAGTQQIVPYQAGQPYVLRPELRLAWGYDFIDDPIDTRAKFVSDPEWFVIPSDERNQQNLVAGLGLTFETQFGSFGVDANGVFGDNTTAFIGKFNAAFRF